MAPSIESDASVQAQTKATSSPPLKARKTVNPPRLLTRRVRLALTRSRKRQLSGQLTFPGLYLSFSAARATARGKRLCSAEEYYAWVTGAGGPVDLPVHPDLFYAAPWKGWEDFLTAPPVVVATSLSTRPPTAKRVVRIERYVDIVREDRAGTGWRRTHCIPNVFARWSRNICRVLATRVQADAWARFRVVDAAGQTEYALGKDTAAGKWWAISFQDGVEVLREAMHIPFRVPAPYDADDEDEKDAPVALKALRPRWKVTPEGRTYRKDLENPRWQREG